MTYTHTPPRVCTGNIGIRLCHIRLWLQKSFHRQRKWPLFSATNRLFKQQWAEEWNCWRVTGSGKIHCVTTRMCAQFDDVRTHTFATISLNPSQTHSLYLPHANVPLHSREGKTCRQTYCFPPLSRTCMCMLVCVHTHTHTNISTVLVRRLLSLNNGAFFTIGDIFPFNTVNAAMPQIADYCSLTDTKKTKQKNVMTCWLEQHQCAFDFWLQLWVWAESGWLLPTETGIALFAYSRWNH